MNEVEKRDFLAFARDRASDLFPMAYALAGRQDAAEQLLQAALEKLALRWRRTEDPFQYAIWAMQRLKLPWWKRYLPVLYRDNASSATLRGVTGGRVVDVGELALAGRHRRRLQRASVAAAVLVVAGATATLLNIGAARDVDEDVDLTGMSLISSFYDLQWYVLDVSAGDYVAVDGEPTQLSPDLATAVSLSATGDELTIESATTGDQIASAGLEVPVTTPRWSPDGNAIVAAESTGGSATFTTMVLVDIATAQATTVELKFPDGRAGWTPTGVFWRSPDELLVTTVDTALPPLPPRPDSATANESPLIVGLTVFRRDGSLVDEVPLGNQNLGDLDAPHAGLMWTPFPLTRGSEVLITRRPSEQEFQIAVLSLAGGTQGSTAVSLALPEHDLTVTQPDGSTITVNSLRVQPYGWLPSGHVLVETARVQRDDTLIVDLDTGDVELCAAPCPAIDLATALGIPLPVPPTATKLSFADADAARNPRNLVELTFQTE